MPVVIEESCAGFTFTPPAVRKSAAAAADLTKPTPVDAEHVYQQLLANYEPKGIEWVRELSWVGPVEIPLDHIDWSNEDSWAANHQKKRVKRFARRIRDGGSDVKPVILVRVPGNQKDVVIDGHHRALAYRSENTPVKAYIGNAPSAEPDDPWFQAHLYQVHGGASPLNKQDAVGHSGAEDDTLLTVASVSPEWDPVSFARKTAGGKIVIRLTDLVKIGPEGYIHGFICVRPPCGEKPGRVKPADLSVQRDGKVVHKKSGWAIGHVERGKTGGWDAHHADGKTSPHATRADAVSAVSRRHNSGKTGFGPEKTPAVVTVKPAKTAPASSKTRSGQDEWKNGSAGTVDYTPAEIAAVARAWYNPDFTYTNQYKRKGTLSGLPDAKKQRIAEDADTFEKVIARSTPFDASVNLYRGMTSGDAIFGKPGSKTGQVVRDDGFGSATANLDFAKSWGPVRAVIHMPPGSRALKADVRVYGKAKKVKGQTPLDQLQEYTLPPGTRYKITDDKVISSGGKDYRIVYLDVIS